MPAPPSPSMTRRVALFGATGTAGRATAHALSAAGHSVIALGRSPCDIPEIPTLPFDIQNRGALAATFQGHRIDSIISCMASRTGAPQDAWAIDYAAHLKLLDAAQDAGLRQFVLLSAICVQKPRLAFQHAKLAFEEALMGSGINYSIVRPTALFKSLSGQISRVQSGKPYMMLGNGLHTACKPISDRDLGTYIVDCLGRESRINRILPIGGPGPALTPLEIGQMLFRLTDRPPAYRRIPQAAIGTIAAALRVAGMLSKPIAAKAEFARIGQYYARESMLVWDATEGRYDEEATPETGSDTLAQHFEDVIAGRIQDDRGPHAVF